MLGDIRLKALKLLDENMQSSGRKEYLDKMNSFIDTAQKQLALAAPIRRSRVMTAEGGMLTPESDMREITAIRSADGERAFPVVRFGEGYRVQDGEYLVEYSAYPKTIDDQTPDEYVLEVVPEAEEAIQYYAAAMCVPADEPQLYAFFLSLFNERIANLTAKKPTVVRIRPGEDAGGWQ